MNTTHKAAPQPQTKALTVPRQAMTTLKSPDMHKAIRAVLPRGMDLERFVAIACAEIQSLDVSKVTSPTSIVVAVYDSAKLGLSLNRNMKEAWLVPFKGIVTLMIGYKGWQRLARNSGMRRMEAEVVYEKDEFKQWTDETGFHFTLTASTEEDTGKVLGVLTRAVFENGESECKFCPRSYLLRVSRFAANRGKSPAYSTWTPEMYRKIAVAYHAKQLPHDDGMADALALEDSSNGAPIPTKSADELAGLGIIDAEYTQTINEINMQAEDPSTKPVVEIPKAASVPAGDTPGVTPDVVRQNGEWLSRLFDIALEKGVEQKIDDIIMAEFGIGKAERVKPDQYKAVTDHFLSLPEKK